ncbi:MAG: Sec-independent protein translocase protein TatB [Pseudomonadota bacterium]|mgnify:CR=1 FL=1|nr:twin-arginine translocase subunit TatB [Gammaproteobacteria bacterium]MEE2684542.1 Sec-independent protein translocase protein TatB [Pseudomonadota bacterium]|tara:strand:+ start:1575 stop:1865 length:291 start_codon:yes stop_codon:yes gene_type:complete
MFDIGFWELALILGMGLLILGPERLPGLVSKIGRWIGKARRTANFLRRQLEEEIISADLSKPINQNIDKSKPNLVTPLNADKVADDIKPVSDKKKS